jgi:chemotaxis protein MotB
MARRAHHEDHVNHEAWAIPYGDLVTLLLAFFVVMYAISSLNEGKYRVLSDAMSEAFGGAPRSISPIQLGKTQPLGGRPDSAPAMATPGAKGAIAPTPLRDWPQRPQVVRARPTERTASAQGAAAAAAREQLSEISQQVEVALTDMIALGLIKVRRTPLTIEIEIRSDILFASGVAVPEPAAVEILDRLARVLQPFPNPLRIEGHTDALPIRTALYPSNWELSSARASSVLHLFEERGVDDRRMAVIGLSATRPVGDNRTAEGRRANRRVIVVVLAHPEQALDTQRSLDAASVIAVDGDQ